MGLYEILGEVERLAEQGTESYQRAGFLGVGAAIVGLGILKLYLLKKYVFERKDKKDNHDEMRQGLYKFIDTEQRKAADKVDSE